MLEGLLGTVNKEKVLLFIMARGEGYPREVARFYGADLRSIQNQFERLKAGGVLSSRKVGNTRLYSFHPDFAFLDELQRLLKKALAMQSAKSRNQLCGDSGQLQSQWQPAWQRYKSGSFGPAHSPINHDNKSDCLNRSVFDPFHEEG